MRIVPVVLVTYECGHSEIAAVGSHHWLCPRCDDAMVDGRLDEAGRYAKWLRWHGETKRGDDGRQDI